MNSVVLRLIECLQTSHILKYKFQIPNSSLFFRILEFQSQNFVHILSFDADLRIPRIMNYEFFTRRNTSYETIAISPTTFISTYASTIDHHIHHSASTIQPTPIMSSYESLKPRSLGSSDSSSDR
jgi:hypothetical protein